MFPRARSAPGRATPTSSTSPTSTCTPPPTRWGSPALSAPSDPSAGLLRSSWSSLRTGWTLPGWTSLTGENTDIKLSSSAFILYILQISWVSWRNHQQREDCQQDVQRETRSGSQRCHRSGHQGARDPNWTAGGGELFCIKTRTGQFSFVFHKIQDVWVLK